MNKLISRITLLLCAIVALSAGWQLQLYLSDTSQRQEAANKRPLAKPFTLASSTGPVSLDSLKGKAVALYFGYSSCPDVCPVDLSILGQALNQLSADELQDSQGLFITLDPERDDAAKLAAYSAYFHPSIKGLQGDLAATKAVAKDYGVLFEKEFSPDGSSYGIAHSAYFYIISPQQRLAQILPRDSTPSELSQAIKLTLNN